MRLRHLLASGSRRLLTAAIAVALIAVATIAVRVGDDSGAERRAAKRASAQAKILTHTQPGVAAQLAAGADKLSSSFDTQSSLLAVAAEHQGVDRVIAGGAGVTAAIHLDGSVLIAGPQLKIWAPASGRLLASRPLTAPIVALAGSSSAPIAASVDEAGQVEVWNLAQADRPQRRRLAGPNIQRRRILDIAITANGSQVCVITRAAVAQCFEVARAGRTKTLRLDRFAGDLPWRPRQPPRVGAAQILDDFSYDEQLPPLALATPDGALARFDLQDAKADTVLKAGRISGRVRAMSAEAYADPGYAVATDTGLFLWNQEEHQLDAIRGPAPSDLLLSESDLTVASRQGLRLVTPDTVRQPELVPHGRAVTKLTGGPGGPVAIHPDGSVSLIDRASTGPGAVLDSESTTASFADRRKLLTTDGGESATGITARHVEQANSRVSFGKAKRYRPARGWFDSDDNDWYINDVAGDQRFVVAGGQDPQGTASILVWDSKSGRPIKRLALTSGGVDSDQPPIVSDVAVLGRRKLLAAYNLLQESIVLFSTENWEQVATIDVGPASGFDVNERETSLMATGISDQQSGVAAGFKKSRLTFVDLKKRAVSHSVRARGLTAAAFSPSGDRVATVDTGGFLRLRTGDGRRLTGKPVLLDAQASGNPAWRPDGKSLAVARKDGTVVLIDPQAGEVSDSLPQPADVRAVGVSWSADGEVLAAKTADDDFDAADPIAWNLGAGLRQRVCAYAAQPISAGRWEQAARSDIEYPEPCEDKNKPKSTGREQVGDPIAVFLAREHLWALDAKRRTMRLGPQTQYDVGGPDAAWSPDGRMGWTTGEWFSLTRPHSVSIVRSWPCPCGAPRFDGETAAVVPRGGTALLRYSAAKAESERLALKGVARFGRVLLDANSHGYVISAFPRPPDRPDESLLYRVDRDGRGRRLDVQVGGQTTGVAAADPKKRQLAFVSAISNGACYSPARISLLDLKTWKLRQPDMPGDDTSTVVRSLRWSSTGELMAVISPSGCGATGVTSRAPIGYEYILRKAQWQRTGRRAHDLQPTSAGLLTLSGPAPGSNQTDLLVGRERRPVARKVSDIKARP